MKLLFDQNLSRKLVNRLADLFTESSHVQFHGLAEKTDTEIWEFAKLNDYCIVTQDADFAEADFMALRPKLSGCDAVALQPLKLNFSLDLVKEPFKNSQGTLLFTA